MDEQTYLRLRWESFIPCKTCGADLGQPCRNLRTGEIMEWAHPHRKRTVDPAEVRRQARASTAPRVGSG